MEGRQRRAQIDRRPVLPLVGRRADALEHISPVRQLLEARLDAQQTRFDGVAQFVRELVKFSAPAVGRLDTRAASFDGTRSAFE